MQTKINALKNFRACLQNAPAGTYEAAREIGSSIRTIMDTVQDVVEDTDLKADNCDLAFALEAAIYDYVKKSNPDKENVFIAAEGFGEHSTGPAGARVISQMERDREALAANPVGWDFVHNVPIEFPKGTATK